jgi:hypothetical protein
LIWAAAGQFAMPHLTDALDSNPPKLVHEVRSGSKLRFVEALVQRLLGVGEAL